MQINIDIPFGISYPSIAVVPFAKGALVQGQLLTWNLLENGAVIRCYREIVALWPDESVKWLHVHGIFQHGKQYSFEQEGQEPFGPFPPIPPDNDINWEVQVEEASGDVWKNTRDDRNLLLTIPSTAFDLSLYDPRGSIVYKNIDETKYEEIKSNFLRVTRYEGWLKNGPKRSSYRYCTWVTRYLDHPLVKISHSLIFAGSMRGQKMKHISFILHNLVLGPANGDFGVDGSNFEVVIGNQRSPVIIHQRKTDLCEVSGAGDILSCKHRADGYISKGSTSMYVREFWQKFPQSMELTLPSMTYRQWYGKGPVFGNLIGNEPERLFEHNLHKMLHLHEGPLLENDIPKSADPQNPGWANKYYAPFTELVVDADGNEIRDGNGNRQYHNNEEGNTAEEFIEYTDHADMSGISIHDEIAICAAPVHYQQMAKAWRNNPVGYCNSSEIESTNVSDFGARSSDFEHIEQFLEDSILSYTDPDRFEDYGRFIYGDSHRNILVANNRPSRHRCWLASYYCAGETYWRMRLRGGSDAILQLARRNTEHYRSLNYVSYDEFASESPVAHSPGGVWYRGLWWGSLRNPGGLTKPWPQQYVQGHSGWNTRIGRIPDYDSFLWSWLLDGNRYHKDGYDRWFNLIKKNTDRDGAHKDNTREFVKRVVYQITGYEYFYKHPNPAYRLTPEESEFMKDKIEGMANSLLSLTFDNRLNGPLWQPEWLKVYVQYLVNYNTSDDPGTLIRNVLNYVITHYDGNFLDGQKSLDMAALLADIHLGKYAEFGPDAVTREFINMENHLDWISRISEKVYKGNDPRWLNFGVGDGELGDAFLKLQWGAFLKRVREFGLQTEQLPEYDHYGHYPCSVQLHGKGKHPAQAHLARGNEYLVRKSSVTPLELKFKFSPLIMNSRGSFSGAEIWVLAPSLAVPDYPNPIKATKFISLFIIRANAANQYIETTDLNYPSGRKCPPGSEHTCTLSEIGGPTVPAEQRAFETFSLPNNIRDIDVKYGWERSDYFIVKNKTDDFTIQDLFETTETGVVRMFINAMSVYPGLTRDNLPEAMVLTNYPISNDESGDYIFTDSKLFYRNPGDTVVSLKFWASVLVALTPAKPKWSAGSFARVKIMDVNAPGVTLSSFDLQYTGLGYGAPSTGITVDIPPGGVALIKIVLIYQGTVVRARMNGKLLCARSLEEVNAF